MLKLQDGCLFLSRLNNFAVYNSKIPLIPADAGFVRRCVMQTGCDTDGCSDRVFVVYVGKGREASESCRSWDPPVHSLPLCFYRRREPGRKTSPQPSDALQIIPMMDVCQHPVGRWSSICWPVLFKKQQSSHLPYLKTLKHAVC